MACCCAKLGPAPLLCSGSAVRSVRLVTWYRTVWDGSELVLACFARSRVGGLVSDAARVSRQPVHFAGYVFRCAKSVCDRLHEVACGAGDWDATESGHRFSVVGVYAKRPASVHLRLVALFDGVRCEQCSLQLARNCTRRGVELTPPLR